MTPPSTPPPAERKSRVRAVRGSLRAQGSYPDLRTVFGAPESPPMPPTPLPWFLPRDNGLPPPKRFEGHVGFTLSIDGARLLPSNCVAATVLGQLYRATGKKMGPEMLALPALVSSAHNPVFAYHRTIRMRMTDATLTLVAKVLVLEKGTGQQKVLGYATLNVFCLANSRRQPADPHLAHPQVVLNEGCFQVPLKQAPPAGQSIRHGMLHTAPPVPCASLLLRITPVASAASTPPPYESGAYDSTMCAFSKSDEAKALARLSRPNVRLSGVLAQCCDDEQVRREAAEGGGPAVEAWFSATFSNRTADDKPLRTFLDPTPDA